jgi:rod shape-determining protein MreC
MKGWGRRNGGGALLAAFLISLALLAAGDTVQVRTASILASTVLRPFQVALTLGPRLGGLWLENRDLRRELEVGFWEGARLGELESENQRLRELLAMTGPAADSFLVAAVIGREPTRSGEVLYVDKGTRHGLKRGTPAVSRARLVGMVDLVESRRSRVLTLWNLQLRVSARIGRAGVGGILRWDPARGRDLVMGEIAFEEGIAPGDTVWTSGMGEIFPPGLLVGTVRSVETDSLRLLQSVRIRPFTSLARLRDLLLVTARTGGREDVR